MSLEREWAEGAWQYRWYRQSPESRPWDVLRDMGLELLPVFSWSVFREADGSRAPTLTGMTDALPWTVYILVGAHFSTRVLS